MPEYLYVEPRKRELPFYVDLTPKLDMKDSVRYQVCDRTGRGVNEWLTEDQLRQAARKLSRAIACETMAGVVLVPV